MPVAADVRVLHVLEAIETGCARHLVDLVSATSSVDHEVVVPPERVGGHTDRVAFAALTAAGAIVHLVDMRRNPASPHNVHAVMAVRRLIRRRQPDVVHGHSTIGGLVARAAAIGTGAVVVYTPNGVAAGAVATAVERAMGRATARFIAVSPSERAEVLRRRLVPEDRIVVVPNGIDLDAPPPGDLRRLVGVDGDVPLIGSVGRLTPQKAPEVLLRSWALVAERYEEAHFVLIGDGALAGAIDSLAAELGLGRRYHRLAYLPGAAAYLPSLDVFTLASRFEGGPYVPLEALRAGVPVVLTDVVGNRDAVENGVTGLLVPSEDASALARGVVCILTDKERARQRVEAGQLALRERFGVDTMGETTGRLYQDLATTRRQRHRGLRA